MTAISTSTAPLRERISLLRRDIADTTYCYQAAKSQGDTERAISLLRTRSTLIQQLFRAQKEFLAAIRAGPDRTNPESNAPFGCH